jgi:hypothetical protein
MPPPSDPKRDPADDEPAEQDDKSMRSAVISVFVIGLCFGIAGFALAGVRTGLGVTLGGLMAGLNLLVFAKVGDAFVSRRGNAAPWGVVALLKMGLLFGGVYLILKNGYFSPLALIAGYAALPVGITVGSLFGPRPPESDGPATPSARTRRNVIQGGRAERGEDPDQGTPP